MTRALPLLDECTHGREGFGPMKWDCPRCSERVCEGCEDAHDETCPVSPAQVDARLDAVMAGGCS